MYINGSAKAGAALLDPSALSPFENGTAPPSEGANKSLSFTISQTDVVTWVIDRAPFMEPDIPLIYGENSSGWDANTTIHLPINSIIDIIMRISNESMDTVRPILHSQTWLKRAVTRNTNMNGRWVIRYTSMVTSSGFWVLEWEISHTQISQTRRRTSSTLKVLHTVTRLASLPRVGLLFGRFLHGANYLHSR